MNNLFSLFLSQSYQDCWDDYNRSLRSSASPQWDYVVLTASNEQQAEGFRKQIEDRKGALPINTKFVVIADRDGKRVGSGGATLSVIRYLKDCAKSLDNMRVLVIHSGGDSKRVPQYSALGKLFSPVPHELPNGRTSTLFDEFLICMSQMASRIKEGMLLLSGDVLLLFNPLQVDYNNTGAATISFKEDVETGKNHGVFLNGDNGNVKRFLHKQTVTTLRECGAVNDSNCVDIDTGAVIFSTDMLKALYSLVESDADYDRYVNDRVRLSLYGDFLYPLAEDSTLEAFYDEKPEGDFSDELMEARKKVWEVLRPYRLKLLRLAPAKFIHFGTSVEILRLMGGGVEEYKDLGWSRQILSSVKKNDIACYNSVQSSPSDREAPVGNNCYLEVSHVHNGAMVGNNVILSYIDISGDIIPDDVILHGLKQRNGRFVARIYGVQDNPKENTLFGKRIDLSGLGISDSEIWDDDNHVLWTANLYPEKDTMKEAVESALELYELVTGKSRVAGCAMAGLVEATPITDAARRELIELWKNGERKSLCSGFNAADPEAIIDWNTRMKELVMMNDISNAISQRVPAKTLSHIDELTKVQREWLNNRLEKCDFSEKIRLHYYVGSAMDSETQLSKCFETIQSTILESTLSNLSYNENARIVMDSHTVRLPLRVNFGGGWSDTPPYCIENGGTVLNVAIKLNGEKPVEVTLERIPERKIVFDSRDMDVHGEFDTIEPLQETGDPFDPFALQKACLLACGILPKKGSNLGEILDRLGGGFVMHSEVNSVPKGSGLGTSSILSAACVKAVFEFMGVEYTEEDLYSHVLAMEQIMSTGGGWQDQVGGVTAGLKYITSLPGLVQDIKVDHVNISDETKKELGERFALIYTGQRRLARNLLRDVIGRYVGCEPDSIFALNEIQKIAALMRFELERGNVDEFARLLDYHWELSRKVDAGSTNTLIDLIFGSIDDLIDGRLVCGAGGGGFLQVMLKKGVTKAQIKTRLKEMFQDSLVDVWDCEFVWD